ALYGVANVLPEVLPLFTWCDPSDVGALVDASQGGGPTLFVFDRYPGGAGFADRAFHSFESILAACCDLIEGCECERGCPSCVGAPAWLGPAGAENGGMERAPDKEAALILLHAWLGREPYHPKPRRPDGPVPAAQGAGDGEGCYPPRGMPLPAGLEQRLRERLRQRRSPA
ncbi:MAG TPA: Zn-binding domain-containing protein, partial [Limnochordia bacterium]